VVIPIGGIDQEQYFGVWAVAIQATPTWSGAVIYWIDFLPDPTVPVTNLTHLDLSKFKGTVAKRIKKRYRSREILSGMVLFGGEFVKVFRI